MKANPKILSVVALLAALPVFAGTALYIRDQTTELWDGAGWTNNPIANPGLAYQAAMFPYVTQGPGTVVRPQPGPTLIQMQFYVDAKAPDQTIAELRPTHLGNAVARIKIEGEMAIIELQPETDAAWISGKKPLHLITLINRGEWNCREILFIGNAQSQTIGWTDIVNNPIDTRALKSPTRMIRQPEEQPWEFAEIAFPKLEGIYLAEIVIDPDISHNERPNGNLKVRQ